MPAFDPYHKWLGIPPKDQPPHCYRLLGIDLFEADPEVIEAAANRQMTYVQGAASGERVADSQKLMKEITQARIVLLDKNKRAAYDAKLKTKLAAGNLKVAPSLERAKAVQPPAVARPAIKPAGPKPAAPKSPPVAAKLGGNPLDLGLQPTPSPRSAGGSSPKKVRLGWQFPFFIVAVLLIVAGGITMWLVLPGMLKKDETLLAGADPAPLETAAPGHDSARTNQPQLPAGQLPGHDGPALPPPVETSPAETNPATSQPTDTDRPTGDAEHPREEPTSDAGTDDPFVLPKETNVPADVPNAAPPRLDPGGLNGDSPFPDKRPGGIDPLTGESLDDLVGKIDGNVAPAPAANPLADPLADPLPGVAEAPGVERRPIPSDLLLRDLRKEMSKQIARPARGLEGAAVAALLDRVRAGQDDGARQFALLDMAQEFAVVARDVALGLQVAQERAARFEIDPLESQAGLVRDFGRALMTKDHEAVQSVRQTCGRLLDRAIREHRYDVADDVIKSLRVLGKRLRDAECDQLAEKYQEDVAVGLSFLDVIRRALTVLENNAGDPEANLTMGSFYAAVRNDWTAAAPYLMKVQNEALNAAASLELSVPTDAAAQYRAAEAWRAVSRDADVERRLAAAAGQRSNDWLLLAWNNAEGDLKIKLQRELKSTKILFENSVGILFVRIPAGQFAMGSPTNEEGRGSTFKYRKAEIAGAQQEEVNVDVSETQHEVRITAPMYFGVYEVTQRQFAAVMKHNPSESKAENQPVENVNWDDAMEFCNLLTKKEQAQTPGLLYRLPTEAEWEYACRAGTRTPFSFGDHLTDVHAAIRPEKQPRPVGSYAPNAFGLFDMHGNILEWVYDEFDLNLYDRLAAEAKVADDPVSRKTIGNRFKIARGGSYKDSIARCRSAARRVLPHEAIAGYIGFRVVLVQAHAKR